MAEAAMCPICKLSVKLTVFGLIPKHGGESACKGAGYTPKEAAAMVMYSGSK